MARNGCCCWLLLLLEVVAGVGAGQVAAQTNQDLITAHKNHRIR